MEFYILNCQTFAFTHIWSIRILPVSDVVGLSVVGSEVVGSDVIGLVIGGSET